MTVARNVKITVYCDMCNESITEDAEGHNALRFTLYGELREIDLCEGCIQDSFLHEARRVIVKKDKTWKCHCGRAYTTKGAMKYHQNAKHG